MRVRPPDKMTGPPRDIFPYVIDFCRSISSDSTPFFIVVTSEVGDAPVDCIGNVRRRIANHGGKEVLGWKVWEWYGVMIEAEFHMLWCTPDGKLRDVTPNAIPFDRVLFLPDASLTYAESQIAIQNQGDRATQYTITLSREEAQKLRTLEFRKAQLAMQIEQVPPGRNELCRCGSGKKYKRCCQLSPRSTD
jgi:hypothetical protein